MQFEPLLQLFSPEGVTVKNESCPPIEVPFLQLFIGNFNSTLHLLVKD